MLELPPEDWSDVDGWDVYHRAAEPRLDASMMGLQYVRSLRARGSQRVWFPGCGTSPGPRAFAELGFDVVCSDFAPVAVAEQEQLARSQLPEAAREMLAEYCANRPPTRLAVRRHDFRVALDVEPFDVVLNVRAYQGLSTADMRATAKTHIDAVKPGGIAIFDTMNVQGEHRDRIEDSLAEAGFEIPLRDTQRWYRSTLRATGVEFVMILGRPMARSRSTLTTDQAALNAVSGEYQRRSQDEADRTRERFASSEVKVAHVVYSTG